MIPEPYEFVLLALAAARAWKLIGDDRILDRPREAALGWLDDRRESGTYWGDFLVCPWCAGAWVSLLAYVSWMATLGQWPSSGSDVLVGFGVWFAISALVGLFGTVVDALT